MFELLKRAYFEARNAEHWAIATEELAALGERAAMLRDFVETRSIERLVQLKGDAPV